MSLFSDTKREGYRAQRTASHASDITLVCGAGKYYASYECATKCAAVLGTRELEDLGEGVKQLTIPTEDLHAALLKLQERYSVALVDIAERSFVLVWRIERTGNAPKPTESTNLEDY